MSTNIIVHGDSRVYVPKLHTPINLVLTDPPYGMNVQMNSATSDEHKAVNQKIEGDEDVPGAIQLFHSVMGPIIPHLATEADLYVFTAWHVLEWWIPAVKLLNHVTESGEVNYARTNGIELKMMGIWDKGYPGKGDLEANWGCGYEPWLYLKKGRRPNPYRRSSIIACDKVPSGQNIHPTEKPVGLLERLIEMSTNPGDFIVDPFSGSGSTSVAAMQLGRDSLAFEIDERFIEKSRARLQIEGLFSNV